MKQVEKILATMMRNGMDKRWTAPDLLKASEGTDLFVGYETSPRMSDLTRMYPAMFITGKGGKYRWIKINRETASDWYPKLPVNIKTIIKEYYRGPVDR